MSARLVIAAVLTCSASASAQNAQDELERQLKEMVGRPPTKLLLEYEGLDQPNYKLAEISFDLDGSTLPAPMLEKLNGEGKHLIFHGDVKPGKHTIEATVVMTDIAGALFSYEAGYKWRLKLPITFEQQAGLEVHIVVIPEVNPGVKDAKKKFTLKSTAAVKMLAKVEDGTMPESPKPNIVQAPAEPPDAGAPVVAELSPAEKAKLLKAEQAEAARLKKQQAMEEAQRKKDEKAAAKAAAIEAAKQKSADAAEARKRRAQEAADARASASEDKKRKAQEAAEARAAAAEDKKRKAQEAAEARKAAEEEKKRQKAEALAAANAAKEPKQPAGPSQPGEPSHVAAADPGGKAAVAPGEGSMAPTEPSQALIDAGPTVAAAEPPKPAQQPGEPRTSGESGEGGGLPLPIIIGVGVAALGLIVFLAKRKKDTPPY